MTLQLKSPFDGAIIGELPRDDDAQVEAKLEAAQRAQKLWRRRPLAERCEAVARGLELFRREADEVAREISLQVGKPLAQSHSELDAMFGRAEHMLAIADQALAPVVGLGDADLDLHIEHEPLGVVFNLAAWNYPLLIPINVIVPALCAGNALLLKHSENSSLCGARFERALAGVGEPGLFAHLVIDHDTCAKVIADERVDHVAFTGSVAGGRAVHRAAADRFIDVGLELGGKDPAYVAQDSDLAYSAPNLVDGACYNAGQSCCAVERAYVHRDRYDDFIQRAEAAMGDYVLGDPLAPNTTMGPMARRSALSFLEEQVRDAVSRGARLVCGGKAIDDVFFEPTLLVDVPQDAAVMQEESFGPILPVRSVASDEEALAMMNDSRFGLTASIWTADINRVERFVRELEAGTVFANRCDYLDPRLPWTGIKDSGRGSTLSSFGYSALTRRKSVHLRRV